ncbi:hypothetical protein F4680DRAFT_438625 [Xylaria scruposa]|nr:hypothetical protein F4680DRAFT_438625 [Xylaria scruposa]
MSSGDHTPSMEDLLEGPALEPPPNTVPDFIHPGGSHTLGYGLVLLGSIVAAVAVLIRLRSSLLLRKIRIDDGLMVSSLGLFGGYQYVIYKHSIFPGIGVHQWNLQLKFLSEFLYDVHIASIFYGLGIMCLKVAILIDWLRIFVPHGRLNAMFWTLHVLIWSNVIFYLAGNFAEIFRCTPREKIWNVFYEGGSCPVNIAAQNFSSGLLNLISDVVILGLPQWIIWRLNMSKTRKFGISLLFVIGIFICICAGVSIYWLDQVLHSQDILYCLSNRGLWGIGEWAAGFLILGIPSAPKVFQSMPFAESAMSLIRSWTSPDSSREPNGIVLQSLRKPRFRKRRGLWDISELETHDTAPINHNRSEEDHSRNETTSEICVNITTSNEPKRQQTMSV